MQSLDDQIDYLRSLAARQYPDNEAAQLRYLSGLLIEKLRGVFYMLEKSGDADSKAP